MKTLNAGTIFSIIFISSWACVYNFHDFDFPKGNALSQTETESSEMPRVVGGMEAEPHSIPFQVGLFLYVGRQTGFCGGSLISKDYVLTAAHCVYNVTQVLVILGAHNIMDEKESSQQRFQTSNFKIHEAYNSSEATNDIAVIKLPKSAVLNDYVKVVTLPAKADKNKSYEHEKARVSGWGRISDSANGVSPVLRYVESPVISNFLCGLRYFPLSIPKTNICTTGIFFKSSCNGDSGGPLTLDDDFQIGIVSFGIVFGCQKSWPSVYTRVTSYLKWIESNTDVKIK